MEELKLKASVREETRKQNNKLRDNDLIPAVIYGRGITNKQLKVDRNQFLKIYDEAKESALIDLAINNSEPVKVLIQDVQWEEVTDKLMHVDFYQVKMDEKISAEINLVFVGVSQPVKELGGTLVKNKDRVEVKCFPNDLIKQIEVDISSLQTFDDLIHAKDLNIPEKLELLLDPKEVIAQVIPPRTEEELKALEEEVKEDVDQVETVEEGEEKEGEEEAAEAEPEKTKAPPKEGKPEEPSDKKQEK